MSLERRFRSLLRLLPPSFRDEHGDDIARAWRDETDENPGRVSRLWLHALRDTCRVAFREYVGAFLRNCGAALRRFRRTPTLAVASVLTIGLGAGATAAVFTLLNAAVLRPFPWHEPDRVGVIWAVQPSGERTWLSVPELEDLQRDSRTLTAIAGMTDRAFHYRQDGRGRELQGLAVSHNFFPLLGVKPAAGRLFVRTDDEVGAAPSVVLGYAFWRDRFGADASAIGRTLTLDGRIYRILGVLPLEFSILPASSVLPANVDIWVPLQSHLVSRERNVRFLHAVARLGRGVSFATVGAEMTALAAGLRRYPAAYPDGTWSLRFVSFQDEVLGRARTTLCLLLGLVGLVLCVACVNVVNLLTARSEARGAELAVRAALGARPTQLAGELIAEAGILSTGGVLLGLCVGAAGPAGMRAIEPTALPRLDDATIDIRVMTCMLVLMLLIVTTFIALPYLERMRLRTPCNPLLHGQRGVTGSARLAKGLVVGQTMLATAILIATFFLTSSLLRLQHVPWGFAPEHVMSGRVSLSSTYSADAAVRFFESTTRALRQAPGVTHAAAVTQLPLSGAMLGSTFVTSTDANAGRIDADLRGITPGYFDVMRVRLIAGRTFSEHDDEDAPQVVIVDETFARRVQPDGQVVGRRVRWFRQSAVELEIVGIVGAVRHQGPRESPVPTVYRPYQQYRRSSMFVVARTTGGDGRQALADAIAEVDSSQPLTDVLPMDERVARSMAMPRASVEVAALLAVLATVLCAIGLYGVLSVSVTQRRREFGVRMALGMSSAAARRLVMREGLAVAGLGVLLGGASSVGVVALVRGTLYETSAADLWIYALGVAVVLIVSAASFGLPAYRAGRQDVLANLHVAP